MLKRSKPLQRKKPLLRSKTRIAPVTPKRAAQLREYSKRRKAYLAANPICEVWLREHGWTKINDTWFSRDDNHVNFTFLMNVHSAPASTEVHHCNKRRGAALLVEADWLAVCHANHERIENNKSWAREQGFLRNF